MSNVIQLRGPARFQGAAAEAALLSGFAGARRGDGDVFWLKENAELLNILESTGARPGAAALEPLGAFYATAEARLSFFPQYYRFILSICLDLEALGMAGDKAEGLCAWAADQGLAAAELSDLQRAEARRLMQRRGIDPLPEDRGLEDRLRGFIARTETFAMPNRKAAYELTHIVFYLSEYGRRDPELASAAVASLDYAGILAFLDQDADLLAEICIALRFAGVIPSPIWEDWLARELAGFAVATVQEGPVADDYHCYLMCGWLDRLRGGSGVPQPLPGGRMAFWRGPRQAGAPLRQMSECMFRLAGERSGDWPAMRPHLHDALSRPAQDILAEAEASSPRFAEFFRGFARPALITGVAS
ncbi:DUF6902 family protein [Pseudodonghicola flavimaris]|uniref:Uncharacterized protein n=1 Tax=Pseudodonghicola flavimaris TaxID=3050036 RepID=A0ABT7EVH6_9RHOB|nr:hypothetical protein [Pseudodonghicola flavimaris]MDK3016336.1 hypothetical protein [Pseudodonghicola flavimaris]